MQRTDYLYLHRDSDSVNRRLAAIADAAAAAAVAQARLESLICDAAPECSFREMADAAQFTNHHRIQLILDRQQPRRPRVYYAQRSVDCAIKIGTSIHIDKRMSELSKDHGALTLLATEPGGVSSERNRHRQFRDIRLGSTEWFAPSSSLLAHIDALVGA